jgi:hypothetical protein
MFGQHRPNARRFESRWWMAGAWFFVLLLLFPIPFWW